MMKSTFPIIQSVIENDFLGKVIQLTEECALLLHPSGFGQLIGKIDQDEIDLNLQLVQNNTPKYFHLYAIELSILEILLKSELSCNLLLRKRVRGVYESGIGSFSIPSQYVLLDSRRMNESDFDKIPRDVYQKFYSSYHSFQEHAWAKVLFTVKGDFCSMCYASAWGDNIAEIDVYTSGEFRGRGLAKIVVSSFIAELYSNGRKASWDCFIDNFESQMLAKKTGFVLREEYWMLSIFRVDERI